MRTRLEKGVAASLVMRFGKVLLQRESEFRDASAKPGRGIWNRCENGATKTSIRTPLAGSWPAAENAWKLEKMVRQQNRNTATHQRSLVAIVTSLRQVHKEPKLKAAPTASWYRFGRQRGQQDGRGEVTNCCSMNNT